MSTLGYVLVWLISAVFCALVAYIVVLRYIMRKEQEYTAALHAAKGEAPPSLQDRLIEYILNSGGNAPDQFTDESYEDD